MLAFDLIGVGNRIGDHDIMTEPLQPTYEVEAAAVPEVGHILLERQAEDQGCSGLATAIMQCVRYPRSHIVIRLASSEDDLGIVADLLSKMAQILRIDADTVAADKSRLETQEIPLGPSRIQYVPYRHA